MKRYGIIFIIAATIGIATAAYALPFSTFKATPFPESASLLILGTGLISVANFVRKRRAV